MDHGLRSEIIVGGCSKSKDVKVCSRLRQHVFSDVSCTFGLYKYMIHVFAIEACMSSFVQLLNVVGMLAADMIIYRFICVFFQFPVTQAYKSLEVNPPLFDT